MLGGPRREQQAEVGTVNVAAAVEIGQAVAGARARAPRTEQETEIGTVHDAVAVEVAEDWHSTDAEDRGGSAHLVADDEQGVLGRRVGRRNEHDSLRTKVAGEAALGIGTEVARVDVLHEPRCGRIGDVERDDPADALEADERVGAVADRAHRNALGLGTLVVAAVVEGVVVVGGVEVRRERRRRRLLEELLAVPDDAPVRGPDGDRPAAEGMQRLEQAVAVLVAGRRGDGQASQAGVRLELRRQGEVDGIEVEVLDADSSSEKPS